MTSPKLSDLKSIHEWIRDASNAEVFFVSLLTFPFFSILYSWAIKTIGLDEYKLWILLIISILYILAILIMKNIQTVEEELEIDLLIIKNHAKSFKKEYISFSRLKEKDKKYNEAYIEKLIRKYPTELIIAKFKESQRGVKILKFKELMLSNF